jgi:hypothetical protein
MKNKYILVLLLIIFLISLAYSASYPTPFVPLKNTSKNHDNVNNYATPTAAVSIATNLGMKAASSSATTVVGGDSVDLGEVKATYVSEGIDPYILNKIEKIKSTFKNWSEEDMCNFIKGCLVYDDNYKGSCYPLGHRINYTYCSEVIKSQTPSGVKKYENKFINQSDSGETCINHYECKSNFCFNKKCINNIEDEMTKLNEEIETLKHLISKLEKNINLITEPESINNSTKEEENTSEQNNYLGLFRKLLNFK